MDTVAMVGQEQMKEETPDFHIGDTVRVKIKVVERERERLQTFQGVVIRRRGAGVHETFTVRQITSGEGVERIFPLHSPVVKDIKVVRSGVTRRSKLYHLRSRRGKAFRLKEKRQ